MADKLTSDTTGPAGGPKTEDSKRDGKVTDTTNQGGADRALADARSNQFGDITSSSSAANNPGQHGRDGGTVNGTDNNPAPSDAAINGETAESQDAEQGEMRTPELSDTPAKPAVKKL